MRRSLLAAVLAIAGVWLPSAPVERALLEARPARRQAPQSTFRAGVDIVQVDVSVLDKQRRPVRGLTAADFILLEDGEPRAIAAFSAVDLPDRVSSPTAPWTTDVAPDVATNALSSEGRLVVLLLDRTIPNGYPTINARTIAKAAVDELGPGDMAAVVYTSNGTPQDFTSDHAALYAAIDGAYPNGELDVDLEAWNAEFEKAEAQGLAGELNPAGSARFDLSFNTQCHCGACVLDTIARVADAVRDVPRRRKSLLFIGTNMMVETTEVACIDAVHKASNAMFKALDLASLTVHSLDPGGLDTLGPVASRVDGGYRGRPNLVRQGNISVLPSHTGGRTVLNTNDPVLRVPEIFGESDSYYLLGFEPAAADGRRHDIKVKVNRRGVDVRTRREFLAAPAAGPPAEASGALAWAGRAIGGVMPARDGVTLSARASAFAFPGTGEPLIAVALHVEHAANRAASPPAATGSEQVELVTEIFTMTGRGVGVLNQTLAVKPAPGPDGGASYDLLQQLPARPGRYELRIGLHDNARHQTGSVYAFVTVPDYHKARFTLGDVELFTPSVSPAMVGNLAGVLPAPPTAVRTFTRQDRATAFVRLSQRLGRTPDRVFVSASVIDDRDRKRYGQDVSMEAASFEATGTADYAVDLPLADLEPGAYLLRIEARPGNAAEVREVRFTVR